jgi:pimeloyl-ACP methyl ester carboxylesterase
VPPRIDQQYGPSFMDMIGLGTSTGGGAAADGYKVTLSALTQTANDFTGQAQQLGGVRDQLGSSTLTAQAFGSMPQSQQVFTAHNTTVNQAAQVAGNCVQRLGTLATGLTESVKNYATGDATVAGYYKSLMGDQGNPLTNLKPAAGATSGAFAQQIADNRTKVANAQTAERANLASLQGKLADLQKQDTSEFDGMSQGVNNYQESQLKQQIDTSQQKLNLYQDILNNNRQIIAFDPSGDGKIAELIGNIGPNTKNVGVLVPGTYTNMADFNTYAKDAASFVQANHNGDLAMVAWANGQFPQSLVPAAMEPGYSQTMAPDLASFSHQLRDQINAQAGPGNDVQVTYAGHSYGGAVVGLAETQGLDANRALYIESAGMGHDVFAPSDLHDMQSNVQRYAMTAPGDPISHIQGVQILGIGHGADPNTFPGVTDLATGNYPNGQPITGLAAHNGVFTTGSGAWQNMYNVFTGSPVTPAPPPPPPPPNIQYYPMP